MKISALRLLSLGPALLLLQLSSFIVPCYAQTNKIFQWQFSNNAISTSLPTCQTFPITVKPFDPNNDTHGVPPFYMMAFAIGGIPTTTLIGENETDINWTVDHPVNTQLMLSVVDSQGSAGGIPPRLYTVVTGQSTQCISLPSDTTSFTVTANVTDTVTTCQPWGLRIKGGVPPYNLTLAAINSPIVTNVTLGANDDAFTYIDRADPNTQLLAAVSDLTGRWAYGTPIVKTQGSADVDCVGLVSSSGNSTQLQQAADAAEAAKKAHKRNSIIIGVCVTLAVLLVLVGGIGTVVYMRRKKMRQEVELGPDTTPKPFTEDHPGQVLSINSFIGGAPAGSPRTPKSPDSYALSSSNYVQAAPFDPYGSIRQSGTDGRPGSGSSNGRPGFTSFPSASVRRSNKAIEAGLASAQSLDSPLPPESSTSDSSSRLPNSATSSRPLRSTSHTASVPGSAATEVVYQHRDGGGIVRELPPPYADRFGPNQAPDS